MGAGEQARAHKCLNLSNTRTCECDEGEASGAEAVEKGEPILASTCSEHDSNQVAENCGIKSIILKDFGGCFSYFPKKARNECLNLIQLEYKITREK
jgi:hypothetical protein